jgi:GTP-binding protein
MKRPVVALVGRPNVGKSTLFNRLAGERLAVVDDRPGTTRDRLVAESEWNGVAFDIVDTGGIDPTDLSRTEPLSLDSADYIDSIRAQAQMAARDADLILFLVEVESGVTPADEEIAQILRKQQTKVDGNAFPPILLVVNRCDNASRRAAASEFFSLGMGEPYPISALHGTGTGDLLDQLVASFKGQATGDSAADDEIVSIAIVGRPNAGKSSLLNRLLGEERVIVSPIPGTTRDAIDTALTYHGQKITLIDTAGIRRRGRIVPGVEKYSVLRALKAVERADVVLLINKWDLIEKDSFTMETYSDQIRAGLNFMPYIPVLFISAKTGQRLHQVLPTALRVQEERLRRIPTGEMNRLLQRALTAHPPPTHKGKTLNILFASQVRTDPPTFLFHVNDPALVHFTYERFLENRIREQYGFLGTPIRLSFRKRGRA